MRLQEHTMALCATCRRAIYVWFDWSMVPLGEDEDWLAASAVDYHWTHWVHPENGHDAVPLASIADRTLMCSSCRQPQVFSYGGWHCGNDHCPTKVDND